MVPFSNKALLLSHIGSNKIDFKKGTSRFTRRENIQFKV